MLQLSRKAMCDMTRNEDTLVLIPPAPRGGTVTWPRKHRKYHRRRQRKVLQGAKSAEADSHCDTMVRI